MSDLKTFEYDGHVFTFYFEENRVILGSATNERAAISQDETGTINIPPHILYNDKVYDVYGTSVYSFYAVKITKLIFPYTLKTLAGTTCESMPNVEYIDLSKTKIPKIAGYTFQYCEKLKTLLLPPTITALDSSSLQSCSSLKSITISPTLKTIASDFCTISCLATIFYCGNYDNGLSLPSAISTIYVPKSYTSTTFNGKEVRMISTNCHYNIKTCPYKNSSTLLITKLLLFIFILLVIK